MKVELSVEVLATIEDALSDALIYDNGGEVRLQCIALAEVRNALGRTPASTPDSVWRLVKAARQTYAATGEYRLKLVGD